LTKKGSDGIKPSVILLIALAALLLFAAAMVGSSSLEGDRSKSEPLRLGSIEPADAPPPGDDLSGRVRTFFIKGDLEECLRRHLVRDQRLSGTLAIELLPDGTVANSEVRTEPANGGLRRCVQQRFSRGFPFEGSPQKVQFSFSVSWDASRLVLGQNVSSSPR
jgi:hypothetical protein